MILNTMNGFLKDSLLGIYAGKPQLLAEHQEVIGYYNYYEGKAKTKNDLLAENTRGQSWVVGGGLDYNPSQDIRNHTKKLIKKQARFMMSLPPTINMKSRTSGKGGVDLAEGKKQFVQEILQETEFWHDTYKAFLDCTIGKRVLLVADANPGDVIKFKYYTMPEFTFETNPNNVKELTQVIIAYQEVDTETLPMDEQIWHRWKYYMENGTARKEYAQYDGSGKVIAGTEYTLDTKLDELPCRVILNGGLTGETDGKSDIEDLIDLANAYNRTLSDYRDALRFKMFEQPVFTDADPKSLESISIAPNALIDLKTDPASEGKQAVASMLSSSFSFVDGAKAFLELTIGDMYEIMDQPRPEDIKQVPSAKAMKFTFYDLVGRCEEKWNEWDPAVTWVINFIVKATKQFNLYNKGYENRKYIEHDVKISLKHNYPIPEDEMEKRTTALKEVEKNTKSRRTYIREFGEVLDEDNEFNEILEEIKMLTEAEDSFKVEEGDFDEQGNAIKQPPTDKKPPTVKK